MKLEPGQTISGTLRLVTPIAEGGMGSVWIAEHVVLGREVALKLMSKQWAAMPQARTRFLREAKMTATIDSPHIVRVLDCRFDEADEPYLVLELLHGENLEQRVRKHGPLSVYEVEEIVAQMCAALGATHAAGIIHRDVKPENVFLVNPNTGCTFVKLLDYGVAKPKAIEDCLDVDRLPAGTPQYMSPEHMFEPETTDERSDLFSLAAVAYFALTGRSPFAAESIEALYFAIEGAKFDRPSEVRPELPETLDAWFERALARDPAKRFQNAHEMATALHDAIVAAASSTSIVVPAPERDATVDTALFMKAAGLQKRRTGRTFFVAAAAVAAVTIWVWRTTGDVKSAIASPADAKDGAAEVTLVAPAGTASPLATPPPARTATSAARGKRPPVLAPPPNWTPTTPTTATTPRPPAARPAYPAQPAHRPSWQAPAPKTTASPALPAAAAGPDPTPSVPAQDALDPDRISTSLRDLVKDEPKPDLAP